MNDHQFSHVTIKNKMEKIDVDTALMLLKAANNVPNLFAHENGAWWIEEKTESHTKTESFESSSIEDWEIL